MKFKFPFISFLLKFIEINLVYFCCCCFCYFIVLCFLVSLSEYVHCTHVTYTHSYTCILENEQIYLLCVQEIISIFRAVPKLQANISLSIKNQKDFFRFCCEDIESRRYFCCIQIIKFMKSATSACTSVTKIKKNNK